MINNEDGDTHEVSLLFCVGSRVGSVLAEKLAFLVPLYWQVGVLVVRTIRSVCCVCGDEDWHCGNRFYNAFITRFATTIATKIALWQSSRVHPKTEFQNTSFQGLSIGLSIRKGVNLRFFGLTNETRTVKVNKHNRDNRMSTREQNRHT